VKKFVGGGRSLLSAQLDAGQGASKKGAGKES
jgi:hypothetical protein